MILRQNIYGAEGGNPFISAYENYAKYSKYVKIKTWRKKLSVSRNSWEIKKKIQIGAEIYYGSLLQGAKD